MQKPSVGRVVHYQSYGTPGGEHASMPRAAIITGTYPEPDAYGPDIGHHPASPTVDLCVLNPEGLFFNRAVRFSETPKPGCWNWPPYVPPK